MRCVDVNVLVYAHRSDTPDHARYAAWLDEARAADEPLGIPGVVLSGFLRLVTNPRIFREPTSTSLALTAAAALRGSPAFRPLEPGPRHWTLFETLCREADVSGDLVPDAWLAAIALENGATLVTADRGFSRFPRLRWEHPLAS